MRELDRLKVVEAVIEQRLMPWRAAERLGISRRQIERLVARYRAAGPAGLASRKRGVPVIGGWTLIWPIGHCRSSVIATPISGRRWPARSCMSATSWRAIETNHTFTLKGYIGLSGKVARGILNIPTSPTVALGVSVRAPSSISRHTTWGAFDFHAFFRLGAFRPGKALPCGPKYLFQQNNGLVSTLR